MPNQFSLRTILLVVFCAAFLLAISVQGGPRVVTILVAILMANFAGAVVALTVTFLFRFPRDGSLRHKQFEPPADEDSESI